MGQAPASTFAPRPQSAPPSAQAFALRRWEAECADAALWCAGLRSRRCNKKMRRPRTPFRGRFSRTHLKELLNPACGRRRTVLWRYPRRRPGLAPRCATGAACGNSETSGPRRFAAPRAGPRRPHPVRLRFGALEALPWTVRGHMIRFLVSSQGQFAEPPNSVIPGRPQAEPGTQGCRLDRSHRAQSPGFRIAPPARPE